MSDLTLEAFLDGDMSPDEEEAFLSARPELAKMMALSAALDGEDSAEAKEALASVVDGPEALRALDELISLEVWMETSVRPKLRARFGGGSSSKPDTPQSKATTQRDGLDSLLPLGAWRRWATAAILLLACGTLLGLLVRRDALHRARTEVETYLAHLDPTPVGVRFAHRAEHERGTVRLGFPEASVGQLASAGEPAAVVAYARVGRLEAALKANARRHRGADGASDRAALRLLKGEPQKALEAAEEALAADAQHPEALFNAALAHLSLGDRAQAQRLLERLYMLESPLAESAGRFRKLLDRSLAAAAFPPPGRTRRYRGAIIGGTLVAAARIPERGEVALRIYLRGVGLVGSCPSKTCQRLGDTLLLSATLQRRGTYEVVRLTSENDIPPPLGSSEADAESADIEAELRSVEAF